MSETKNELDTLRERVRELRRHLETFVCTCPDCTGKGNVERREYDAASGSMEWAGYEDCRRCGEARKYLAALNLEEVGAS